jgi:hypothetical protein
MPLFRFAAVAIVLFLWIPSVYTFSVGQAIQSVSTSEEGFQVAADFWLPSDPDLPPHYQQQVHHETRQRWASQLLEKLFTVSDDFESLDLADPRFDRLVNAAAIPHEAVVDRPKKEGSWILSSLQGIHGLLSRKLGLFQSVDHPSFEIQPETLKAIETLIERACLLSNEYSLDQACQVLWSIEGLYARVLELEQCPKREHLRERVSNLPFDIVPRGLDWRQISESSKDTITICNDLVDAIPFSKEIIVTRQGVSVAERRGTAWIAQEGIGTLAYSGKLMTPKPIPPLVSKVMRSVEEQLSLGGGDFFDCALCNHYTDATSACKFHTDPEHGSFWDRTTVVVAAGSDRKFAFKPIDTTWLDWDPLKLDSSQQTIAANVHLFSGDLVVMTDNCNDDFYHAVYAGENDKDRISLVLKRALDRGNGRKGHGQQGEGRRSKRKLNTY